MNYVTPVDLAVSKVRRAALELSSSDEQQAARMLREALKLQPGHAELLGDLAVLHLQAGRHAQCIQAAREALAADPTHDESAYALALALEATGDFSGALSVVTELVSGARAERFARHQPQLAELCRTKLAQLQAAQQVVNAPPTPEVARAAPTISPTKVEAPATAPLAASPRSYPGGQAARRAARRDAEPVEARATPYAPSVVRVPTLGTLLGECSGIAELTLDCFDTILWRHTDKPDDVFYEMQSRPAFVSAAIDAQTRFRAERLARQMQQVRTGRTEVSLDQIYLAARPDLSPDVRRWLAEDELAAEMAACHAHPGAVRLLRDARARGIPVTIVSDTYFSAEQLRRLLTHCLPADAIAAIRDIVCSSEHGVCKSQGLFKLARLNLASNAATILHVGDNKDADFHAPRALGMSATHLLHEANSGVIRRSMGAVALSLLDPSVRGGRPMHAPYRAVHATCGVDTPAPHAAIGFSALGPMMHAFARWIDEEATTLAATAERVKLVFLMRDAHLPLRSYRELGAQTPSYSAHISRFSAYAASFRQLEHVDDYLANFAQNLTLPMLARQLLLSQERASALISQAELSPNPRQAFLAAVRQPGVLGEIFEASAAYRARLRRYLEREVEMQPGDTIVLVDLGYAGTIQRVLGPVLREECAVDVLGRYLLAVNPVDETRKALIDRSWLDDRALAALQPYVGLIETLSASQGESAVGYDDEGSPIFETRQIADAQNHFVAEIQGECLRFVRMADDYFGAARQAPSSRILRDEALASFGRMLFFPNAEELNHLGRFKLEINLGSDVARKLFDLEAGLDGLRRHGLFYVNAVRDVSDLRMAVPAELRAASMELSLSLLAQHRFGLPFFRSEWSARRAPVQVIFARGAGSAQMVIDAMPTHDGYFSAMVPVSDEPADIALALGRDYRWIQVHSMELVPFAASREGLTADTDVRPLFVGDGVHDHGDGLLEFDSADAMLMLPVEAMTERSRGAIRLVFRPIAQRVES